MSNRALVLIDGEMVMELGHAESAPPLLPKSVAVVASVEMVVNAAAAEKTAAPAAPVIAAVATALFSVNRGVNTRRWHVGRLPAILMRAAPATHPPTSHTMARRGCGRVGKWMTDLATAKTASPQPRMRTTAAERERCPPPPLALQIKLDHSPRASRAKTHDAGRKATRATCWENSSNTAAIVLRPRGNAHCAAASAGWGPPDDNKHRRREGEEIIISQNRGHGLAPHEALWPIVQRATASHLHHSSIWCTRLTRA